jgi:preprotein translocase subunit SecG
MTTFVTIVFVTVSLVLVISILLQAGRGGGLSAGLGGASQGVFGGGGGADFMSRLTQAVAAVFMLSAVYLAYEGAHTGSEFLRDAGREVDEESPLEPGEVDWENLVGSALPLPEGGSKPTAIAPVVEEAPSEEAPAPDMIEAAEVPVEGPTPEQAPVELEKVPIKPAPSVDTPRPAPFLPKASPSEPTNKNADPVPAPDEKVPEPTVAE